MTRARRTPSATTWRPASQASNQGSGDGYVIRDARVDGLRGSAPADMFAATETTP
jgi:hypothetical protein